MNPKEKAKETYGAQVVDKIEEVWAENALPKSPQGRIHMDYFLSRGEESPQGEGCEKCKDEKDEHMLHMVYKLVLYAPVEWFDVVTKGGVARPEAASANDFKHIGVAFDASSRLRRAGITYYHEELSKKCCMHNQSLVYYISPGAGDGTFVSPHDGLPTQEQDVVRVVTVGCTHEINFPTLPPSGGDVLVHAGDMGYEESRSLWEKKWRDLLAELGSQLLTATAAKAWLEKEKIPLAGNLRWLSKASGFRDKILIGGNHDYILEQMDATFGIAGELCAKYGLTYLRTEEQPRRLDCSKLVVWGSGLSAMSQVGGARAVVSGNNSFQHDVKDEQGFDEKTNHLGDGEQPHLMVMHGPPCNVCLGKDGKDLPGVSKLIERMKPQAFVSAHAHNPKLDDLKQGRQACIGETLVVNTACLGTWNQAHGTPVVMDLKLPGVVNSRTYASEAPFRLQQFLSYCCGCCA